MMTEKEYAARFAKVDGLLMETQKFLNEEYLSGSKANVFRFDIGANVLFVVDGVYHQGTVSKYYESCVTESHPRGPGHTFQTVPVTEWIPTILILKTGAVDKIQNTFVIPENELISRDLPKQKGNIQGLLLAHEWNTLFIERFGKEEQDLGVSGFFLDDDIYQTLDSAWQRMCGKPQPFKSYCR